MNTPGGAQFFKEQRWKKRVNTLHCACSVIVGHFKTGTFEAALDIKSLVDF